MDKTSARIMGITTFIIGAIASMGITDSLGYYDRPEENEIIEDVESLNRHLEEIHNNLDWMEKYNTHESAVDWIRMDLDFLQGDIKNIKDKYSCKCK